MNRETDYDGPYLRKQGSYITVKMPRVFEGTSTVVPRTRPRAPKGALSFPDDQVGALSIAAPTGTVSLEEEK